MFRCSVKGTGYPLHSPVSPSPPLPCVTVCHRISTGLYQGRLRLKCDGTRAETRFRFSAQRTSPFKSAGGVSSVDYWHPRCAASAVVKLDTPCSEVVCIVPTPFANFPVTSPPVRHRVPSHFNWTLPTLCLNTGEPVLLLT